MMMFDGDALSQMAVLASRQERQAQLRRLVMKAMPLPMLAAVTGLLTTVFDTAFRG